MPDEQLVTLRWQAELDQLAIGMRLHDEQTEGRCRMFLALLARDASSETIAEVIQALVDQCERRMNGATK